MDHTWIVVADRIEARIFREKPFERIATLANPLGREKNRALSDDKPGWSRRNFSESRSVHALTGERIPHEEAAIDFAREISHFLNHHYQLHRFDQLVMIAEPKMLGRIRHFLPKRLHAGLDWMAKDFGHLNDLQIGLTLGLTSRKTRRFRNQMGTP